MKKVNTIQKDDINEYYIDPCEGCPTLETIVDLEKELEIYKNGFEKAIQDIHEEGTYNFIGGYLSLAKLREHFLKEARND